jgi:hypothetical protein
MVFTWRANVLKPVKREKKELSGTKNKAQENYLCPHESGRSNLSADE